MKLTTDTLLLLIILGLLCFLIYDKVIKEPFYDEDEYNFSSQKCWNNSEDRINNDIDNWMHDRLSIRHNNQSMMDALREPCRDGIHISNKC